jgi:Spy/CpxP family protein refolding chaperone
MKWLLSKYLIAAYLSAIFAAGGVSGWVVASHKPKPAPVSAPPRPDEMSKFYKHRIHERLNLSDDQKKKVDAVIDRSSAEIQRIMGENMKAVRQSLNSRSSQIKCMLNPEQQEAFAKLEKERFEPWHGPGPWKGKDQRWPDKGQWGKGARPTGKDGSRNKNGLDGATNNALKEPVAQSEDQPEPQPKAN